MNQNGQNGNSLAYLISLIQNNWLTHYGITDLGLILEYANDGVYQYNVDEWAMLYYASCQSTSLYQSGRPTRQI